MSLRRDLNLADPDGFYEKLLDVHAGLTAEQVALLDAKLILLLANHVGDAAVLDEALRLARADLDNWPRASR
jgi:hypothetical protein